MRMRTLKVAAIFILAAGAGSTVRAGTVNDSAALSRMAFRMPYHVQSAGTNTWVQTFDPPADGGDLDPVAAVDSANGGALFLFDVAAGSSQQGAGNRLTSRRGALARHAPQSDSNRLECYWANGEAVELWTVDGTGGAVARHRYSLAPCLRGDALSPTDDGGAIVLAHTSANEPDARIQSVLFRVAPDGDVLWAKTVDAGAEDNRTTAQYLARVTPDRWLVIVGSVVDADRLTGAVLAEISDAGQIVSTTSFAAMVSGGDEPSPVSYLHAVAPAPGGYLMSGTFAQHIINNEYASHAFVARVNAGSVQWALEPSTTNTATRMHFNDDGTTSLWPPATRLDASGQSLWSIVLPDSSDVTAFSDDGSMYADPGQVEDHLRVVAPDGAVGSIAFAGLLPYVNAVGDFSTGLYALTTPDNGDFSAAGLMRFDWTAPSCTTPSDAEPVSSLPVENEGDPLIVTITAPAHAVAFENVTLTEACMTLSLKDYCNSNDESVGSCSACTPLPHSDPVITSKKVRRNLISVVVSYNFPEQATGRRLVLRTAAWTDAMGRSFPSTVVHEWAGDDPALITSGPFVVSDFTVPSSARQIPLIAEARYSDPTHGCESFQRGYAATECNVCNGTVGDPVFVADGNMRYAEVDPLPPLMGGALERTFDSGEGQGGIFGPGWMTMFDQKLNVEGSTEEAPEIVQFTTANNQQIAFGPDGVQVWPTSSGAKGTLRFDATAGGYVYRPPGGTIETIFNTDGLFGGLRDVGTGRRTSVQRFYTNGVLTRLTATDSWSGVVWDMTLTSGSVTSIATAGFTWTYAYTNGALTQVTSPEGTWRTYVYGSSGITEIRDGAGKLIESHQYDATGRATSSSGPSDEIANVQYDLSAPDGTTMTRVTTSAGAVMDAKLEPIGGAYRPTSHDGGCSSCGKDEVVAYDGGGRVLRRQNSDGYISLYSYSPTQLTATETYLRPAACDPSTVSDHCRQTSASLATVTLTSTSAAVTTTFAYADSHWPDKPTTITTTSALHSGGTTTEQRTYDLVSGELLVSTVTGWTGSVTQQQTTRTTTTAMYDGTEGAAFEPGGAFTWTASPQPHLPRSVDGPRTDVADVTEYVYYPNESTVPAFARGRLAATRDAAGHVTRFETYDAFGNATRIVDPNEVVTVTATDDLGRVLTQTIQGGHGCDTVYDPLCATNLTTTWTYNGAAALASVTKPTGAATAYEYDDRGRISAISRGPALNDLRERLEYDYDAATGKPSQQRALARENNAWAEKHRTSWTYDTLSRIAHAVNADNTFVSYTYDPSDRIATIQDENHSTPNTQYAYDPAGRVRSVTQTLSSSTSGSVVTQYASDVAGNVSQVTDPNGNITTYTFDDFGQLLRQVSPVTGTTTYVYDAGGDLTSMTDANGATTTRTYDAVGRLTEAESARSGADTETVTYEYDGDACGGGYGVGRLTTMNDPVGESAYCYDRRGLLLTTIDGNGSSVGYRYDLDGNRNHIYYPSTLDVTYTYDFAGRPSSVTASGTPVVTAASYLPFGPATQLAFGNGATKTTTYTSRYLPSDNQLVGPNGTIAHYTYATSDAGDITQIHDATSAAYNRDFAYDDLHRLVTATGGASLWGTGSYTYDAMGNMQTLTLGTRSLTFSYSGTTPKLQSVSGTAPATVTYDSAGNETSSGSYSARNLLQSVGSLSSGTTYQYDGRGVRITETFHASQSSSTSTFVYSPELHLLARNAPDQNCGLHGCTDLSADYVWFDDQPVAQVSPAGDVLYTFTDHLGTPILQTDADASVVWRAEYEPFGAVYKQRTGTTSDQILRFPGQEQTASRSDTNYNIFRWYRAGWGRYTQADPTGFGGGDRNLYRYSHANAVNASDPDGLSGYVTIYSEANAGNSAPVWDGHAFIVYQSDDGEATSWGTFGFGVKASRGLNENWELDHRSDYFERTGEYDVVSRTMWIDDQQEAALRKTVERYRALGTGAWQATHPCSGFAADAWAAATGERYTDFDPGDVYHNPATLARHLRAANRGLGARVVRWRSRN